MTNKPKSILSEEGRVCTKCGEFKQWSHFNKGSAYNNKTSRCNMCRAVKRKETPPEKLREYCNRYEKTVYGFLMRAYRNMKSRVEGVQKQKDHLYKGKEILNKEDFYRFSMFDKSFIDLFSNYVLSGYERKLCPSPDRVDSSKGYTIENIEWVTLSENSKRGASNR